MSSVDEIGESRGVNSKRASPPMDDVSLVTSQQQQKQQQKQQFQQHRSISSPEAAQFQSNPLTTGLLQVDTAGTPIIGNSPEVTPNSGGSSGGGVGSGISSFASQRPHKSSLRTGGIRARKKVTIWETVLSSSAASALSPHSVSESGADTADSAATAAAGGGHLLERRRVVSEPLSTQPEGTEEIVEKQNEDWPSASALSSDQLIVSAQSGELPSQPASGMMSAAAAAASTASTASASIGQQPLPNAQQPQQQQQQPSQQQKQPNSSAPTTAAAAAGAASSGSKAKQSKEEKAKERERKREEQLWRRHQIELQLKQRGIAVSPCGRWIKHNLKCGEGAYKRVFRGYDREQGRPIAWCELKFQVGKDKPAEREQVRKEVEMMIKCEHPNIVRYYDLFEFYFELEENGERGEKVKATVIITEFMSEGTLKEKMKTFYNEQTREAVVDFNVFQSWMQQILEGLRHMHHKMKPPVIHRDLKPENVFIADGENPEEYYNIKIGDFGLATAKTQTRKTMLGTLGYMAPEMLQERYDEKVDIFAFGILIVEMVTNSIPYQECQNFLDVWQRIASNTPPKVLTRIESQDVRDMFFTCTHPLPDFRPTVEELLSLQIFNLKPIPIQLQLVRLSQTLKWQDAGDTAADGSSTLSGEPPKKVAANLRDQEPVEYSGDPNKFYHVADFRLVVNDRTLQQQMRILPGVGFEFQLDCFIDEDLETVVNSFADFAESDNGNNASGVSSDQQKRLRQKLVSSIRHQLNYYRKKVLAGVWSHFMEKIRESEPEQDSETDASPIVRLGLQARRWAEAKRRTLKERDDYNARWEEEYEAQQQQQQDDSQPSSGIERLPTQLQQGEASIFRSADSSNDVVEGANPAIVDDETRSFVHPQQQQPQAAPPPTPQPNLVQVPPPLLPPPPAANVVVTVKPSASVTAARLQQQQQNNHVGSQLPLSPSSGRRLSQPEAHLPYHLHHQHHQSDAAGIEASSDADGSAQSSPHQCATLPSPGPSRPGVAPHWPQQQYQAYLLQQQRLQQQQQLPQPPPLPPPILQLPSQVSGEPAWQIPLPELQSGRCVLICPVPPGQQQQQQQPVTAMAFDCGPGMRLPDVLALLLAVQRAAQPQSPLPPQQQQQQQQAQPLADSSEQLAPVASSSPIVVQPVATKIGRFAVTPIATSATTAAAAAAEPRLVDSASTSTATAATTTAAAAATISSVISVRPSLSSMASSDGAAPPPTPALHGSGSVGNADSPDTHRLFNGVSASPNR